MPKFQLVSAYVNLSGSRDNVVFKGGLEAITYPESLVLAALHGGAEHVHTVVIQGSVDRMMQDEFDRLTNIYGPIVEKVFPPIGNSAILPLGDDKLPTQEEVDAAAAAATEAADKIRAKRAAAETTKPLTKAQQKAAAAEVAAEVETTGPDTALADALAGLPSLDALPE